MMLLCGRLCLRLIGPYAHKFAGGRSASILKDGRAVFNIGGNKYRIVVWINYDHRVISIRFIGTHTQYDRVDAQTI